VRTSSSLDTVTGCGFRWLFHCCSRNGDFISFKCDSL